MQLQLYKRNAKRLGLLSVREINRRSTESAQIQDFSAMMRLFIVRESTYFRKTECYGMSYDSFAYLQDGVTRLIFVQRAPRHI